MKKLFLGAIGLFFVLSCEKEIKLEEDEISPRIVVNGIISDQDTIRIHLSESRSILYNETLPNLENADAKLFDNNNNLLGSFVNEGNGYYCLNNIALSDGSSYKLTVTATGLESVTSMTYIPSPISITQVDKPRKVNKMNYTIHFTDNPNEKKYLNHPLHSRELK